MADIVNLRRVRKTRARAQAEEKAQENRIAFGRPKAARTLQERRDAVETERHEGHRLDPDRPNRDPAA